jgi:cytidylate kinase
LKYKNKFLQISCDGGAATGKSTGAKMISKKYKLKFLSSGLLYRYVVFLLLKYKPKKKMDFIEKKFKNLNYNQLERVNLHTPLISQQSSIIAKNEKIRRILKKFQINFSKKNKNCCIEGRDISTKILPNSDLKFYFICNLSTAAKRRFKELKRLGMNLKLKDVKKALRIRNKLDINRKHSPLLKHRNSIVIDSGKYDKKAMLVKMSFYVENFLKNKYGNRRN